MGISRASDEDIHDYLKSGMGEKRYRELKKCKSVRLQNVYIRRTAVGGNGKKKGIVNHDAMVVELTVQEGNVHYIRAEKMMHDSRHLDRGEQVRPISGIVISWMPDFYFDEKLDTKYDCFGSAIPLKQVLEVLKAPPPKYDLIEANSWHYAATATRDLIKKLRDNVHHDDVRAKLQRVLDTAEKHLKHSMTVVQSSISVIITVGTMVMTAVELAMKLLSDPSQKKNKP